MQLLDHYSSRLLLLFTIPLLFIPKINLIKFGGIETAGVRIDDCILLTLSLIVFWAHFSTKKHLLRIEKQMAAIFALSMISFCINRFLVADGQLHVDAKIHYTLRIFEYFLFFYIGLLLGGPRQLRNVLYAFLFITGTIMIAQKFALIGQFSNFGYTKVHTGRIMGIASFPSEMGALLNLVFCYLLFDEQPRTQLVQTMPPVFRVFIGKTYIFWLFAIAGFLTFLTGSRIAILATLLIFTIKCFQLMRKRSLGTAFISFLFLIVCTLTFTFAATQNPEVIHRSKGLLSSENVVLVNKVWKAIDTHYDPNGHEVVKYAKNKNDMSWWIRIHKWCYAFKIYCQHPQCYLQGIGPGFATAGLDGGLLRIFVEYGIIGLLLFLSLFHNIAKLSPQLKWMTVAFLLNMLFFDVYLAYKPMSLIFLAAGTEVRAKDEG